MASPCYFLMEDGFWSYTGFVASEVIILTTMLTVILILDSVTSCRCCIPVRKGIKEQANNKSLATGIDMSDDDSKKNYDEYSEEDSRVHLNKSAIKTKQDQINMLEDLVAQIRQEKEKFNYERDMIEREKIRIKKEKDAEYLRLEKYVNNQRQQRDDLQRQLDALRAENNDLIQ